MKLLALDSATRALSVALVELDPAGALRAVRAVDGPRGKGQHAEVLPGLLLELLEAEGLALRDLDGLALGLGPGSFTGLRTGAATLKALAWGARLPLAGASSLAAMALEAAEQSGAPGLFVPCLDARRAQVYAGRYRVRDGRVESMAPDGAIGPDELLEALGEAGEPVHLFGGGGEAYPQLAASRHWRGDLPRSPSAAAVARLAAPGLGSYDRDRVFALLPRYLRRSEAELKREAGDLRIPGLTEPAGESKTR